MTCEACRTIPPVISQGYTPKGRYETIAGLKTYITGSTDATNGVVDIYDIFGFSNQTLQGADLLATRLDALVLVPDFFKGHGAKLEWFPPDNEEKLQALGNLIENEANIPNNVEVLKHTTKAFKAQFPAVTKWVGFGLCWGGKVTVLASGPDAPYIASGQVHPGRMDKADAEKVTIPHIVLASKDEEAVHIQGYEEIIAKNGTGGVVETYSTMWHGWMGARANLEEEHSRAEYIRGYNQLADFFQKYLN